MRGPGGDVCDRGDPAAAGARAVRGDGSLRARSAAVVARGGRAAATARARPARARARRPRARRPRRPWRGRRAQAAVTSTSARTGEEGVAHVLAQAYLREVVTA